MAKYLKDRRDGTLYGWNKDMARLGYLKEVDDNDPGFDDGKGDPDYYDPDHGRTVGEMEKQRDEATQAALANAAREGEAALAMPGGPTSGSRILLNERQVDGRQSEPLPLGIENQQPTANAPQGSSALDASHPVDPAVNNPDEQQGPQFDEDGHLLLGYAADGDPVFETDEERDTREAGEGEPEPEGPSPEETDVSEQQRKPSAKTKRK